MCEENENVKKSESLSPIVVNAQKVILKTEEDDSEELRRCRSCDKEITEDAKICWNCKHYQSPFRHFFHDRLSRWIPLFGLLLGFLSLYVRLGALEDTSRDIVVELQNQSRWNSISTTGTNYTDMPDFTKPQYRFLPTTTDIQVRGYVENRDYTNSAPMNDEKVKYIYDKALDDNGRLKLSYARVLKLPSEHKSREKDTPLFTQPCTVIENGGIYQNRQVQFELVDGFLTVEKKTRFQVIVSCELDFRY